MKFSLPLLTAFVAPLLASAFSVTPEPREAQSFNPYGVELSDPLAAAPQDDNISNAERLRRGLKLKSPRSIHHPTRAQAARRSAASSTSRSGYIKIVKSDDNSDAGYVSKDFNVFGEYGLTDNADNALRVSFSTVSGGSGAFDLSNRDQDSSAVYPFIGFTNGFGSTSEEYGPGSSNYAYMTGVPQGKNDASAGNSQNSFSAATGILKTSQSTVWTFDSASNIFSTHWSNPNGNAVSTDLVYYGPDDTVIATGSSDAFIAKYPPSGGAAVYKIKLVLVEAAV